MSVIHQSNSLAFISHEEFLNEVYKCVVHQDKIKSYAVKKELFLINTPYKKAIDTKKNKHGNKRILVESKYEEIQKDITYVQDTFKAFHSQFALQSDCVQTNTEALETAKEVYDKCGENLVSNAVGGNKSGNILASINQSKFLMPKNCNFYCKNIADISSVLVDEKYDLILLDPPWWNKYIRRKKAKTDHAYEMLYNKDIKSLPIEKLLTKDGLVVVWCTNSHQHLNVLINEIFPSWNIDFVAKWFWLKVSKSMEPICSFSEPPGKQPFEQIIFGCQKSSLKQIDRKTIVSIPSALHSHKPPLVDLLKPLLPENPKCLEIFARYLLPNWTSYGLEAIKLQHESLYTEIS